MASEVFLFQYGEVKLLGSLPVLALDCNMIHTGKVLTQPHQLAGLVASSKFAPTSCLSTENCHNAQILTKLLLPLKLRLPKPQHIAVFLDRALQ